MTSEENQLPSADERIATIPEPPTNAVQQLKRRDASKTILLLFSSMGMALGLMGAAVALGSRDEAIERSERNSVIATEAKTQAQGATDAVKEANRRLAAAGKPTVPVPSITEPPPPPDEFTAGEAAAVRGIVAAQLASNQAVLTQAEITQIARVAATLVPKPADGKPPSAAQVQTVVSASIAAYCTADRCRGPQGIPGESIKGDPAPKITDAELLTAAQQAVTSYCGQDTKPCKGEPGASVTGPPGVQGRSVTDMDCLDDGRWRITYDQPFPDGETVRYSRGPCRIGVLPTSPTTEAKSGR